MQFSSYFPEDLLDGLIISPSIADFLVVDVPPEYQRFLWILGLIIPSELGGECPVSSPEEVQSPIIPLPSLGFSSHSLPFFELLFPF